MNHRSITINPSWVSETHWFWTDGPLVGCLAPSLDEAMNQVDAYLDRAASRNLEESPNER